MFDSLIRTATTAGTVVTWQEMQEHCNIATDTDQTVMEFYIKAAQELTEDLLGRSFLDTTWACRMPDFPYEYYKIVASRKVAKATPTRDGAIVLPRSPVQASYTPTIVYIDTTGVTVNTFVAGTDFNLDQYSEPGILFPAYGTLWPQSRDVRNAITVTFKAGYGTTAANVPDKYKQMVRLLAAAWYENREAVTERDLRDLPRPIAYNTMLSNYRVPWGIIS